MTLERAVEVLNRERHRGDDEWRVVEAVSSPPSAEKVFFALGEGGISECLSEFEAVAIAEKYERLRAQEAAQ